MQMERLTILISITRSGRSVQRSNMANQTERFQTQSTENKKQQFFMETEQFHIDLFDLSNLNIHFNIMFQLENGRNIFETQCKVCHSWCSFSK